MKKNGALKIEKGVPMPVSNQGGGRGWQPVLRAMQTGESVLLPAKKYANAWTAACSGIGKGNFKVRAEGKGFRVWRTS